MSLIEFINKHRDQLIKQVLEENPKGLTDDISLEVFISNNDAPYWWAKSEGTEM